MSVEVSRQEKSYILGFKSGFPGISRAEVIEAHVSGGLEACFSICIIFFIL